MDIRRMDARDEAAVRKVCEICAPDTQIRPTHWFFVHPTLVAVEDGKIVGFTSFVINELANGDGTIVLHCCTMCVLPEYRRRGIAKALYAAREAIGRESGATMFCGNARPGNTPMLKIFRAHGLKHFDTIQLPDGPVEVHVGSLGAR